MLIRAVWCVSACQIDIKYLISRLSNSYFFLLFLVYVIKQCEISEIFSHRFFLVLIDSTTHLKSCIRRCRLDSLRLATLQRFQFLESLKKTQKNKKICCDSMCRFFFSCVDSITVTVGVVRSSSASQRCR